MNQKVSMFRQLKIVLELTEIYLKIKFITWSAGRICLLYCVAWVVLLNEKCVELRLIYTLNVSYFDLLIISYGTKDQEQPGRKSVKLEWA